ncbi:MAG: ABC transporter ATP-binding protein [Beutenbergiaceae bacterium]
MSHDTNPDTSGPILHASNLSFGYAKGEPTFSELGFDLDPGQIFTILGANGTGKSTLLNCLGRLLTPTGGEVCLLGRPLAEYAVDEFARVVGYVPQVSTELIASSVRDYVVMGRAPYLGMLSVPGVADYDLADEALRAMEITHLADKPLRQISGGERQQVHIARVLVQEPRLVLLDEPTNHLDFGNQLKVLSLIAGLADRGLAVVLTTHVPDHAMLLDGQVGMLGRTGRMVTGPAGEVITEQALRDLYETDLHLVHVGAVDRMACIPGRLAVRTSDLEIAGATKN